MLILPWIPGIWLNYSINLPHTIRMKYEIRLYARWSILFDYTLSKNSVIDGNINDSTYWFPRIIYLKGVSKHVILVCYLTNCFLHVPLPLLLCVRVCADDEGFDQIMRTYFVLRLGGSTRMGKALDGHRLLTCKPEMAHMNWQRYIV